MNRTKIEYLDRTLNLFVGCSQSGVYVSAFIDSSLLKDDCACSQVCWAAAQAKRRKHKCSLCYYFILHYHSEREPQLYEGHHLRVGLNYSAETFDEAIVKDPAQLGHLREMMAHVRRAYWNTFIILTKQPQNIHSWLIFPKNVWLGVTVNRKKDLWRLEKLNQVEASVKFVSFEPLYEDLGDIDLSGINWVIIGAQTRPQLLPKLEWIAKLNAQAVVRDIPVFFKNNLLNIPKEDRLRELPITTNIRE